MNLGGPTPGCISYMLYSTDIKLGDLIRHDNDFWFFVLSVTRTNHPEMDDLVAVHYFDFDSGRNGKVYWRTDIPQMDYTIVSSLTQESSGVTKTL